MQTKNIKQTISLHCTPQIAYKAWLDSKHHGEMVNGKAVIDPQVGGKFSIWDDYLIGKTTKLDPQKYIIIQDWRDDSSDWPEDYYSEIMLTFEPNGEQQTKLHFQHNGIPSAHAKSIEDGWNEYYWEPMQKYFSKKI